MPTLRSLRSPRIIGIAAAAVVLSATPALAQRCLGLPMAGKNYIGFEQRESWTGHGRQTPVYGGRYAHSFDAGKGVGVIASLGGGGSGMKGDTSAVHVSGMLSTSIQPVGSNLSMCAGAGFEAQAVDYPGESKNDADAFGSIPMSLGLGYDMHVGALTLTPFAAPTIAFYEFESSNYKDGDRQHGFDTYVTMGATAAFTRFSVGATYRNGDRSLGQSGRFAFSTGVNF
jgi:hypothetical protein